MNFHSADLIADHLQGVPTGEIRVYVGDNSDTEAGRREIAEVCAREGFQLLRFSSNLGFGRAINRLAAHALADDCSHLLLLNPDAYIGHAELLTLWHFSRLHPRAIVSPTIENDAGNIWFEGGELDLGNGLARHSAWTSNPDWITGACMLFPVTIWESLGGFVESYFPYWEDVDFTFRWRMLGGELCVLLVRAKHSVGATQLTSSGSKSPLCARYNARNRLLFAGNNLGLRDLIRWGRSASSYRATLLNRFGLGSPRSRRLYKLSMLIGEVEGAILGAFTWARRRWSGAPQPIEVLEEHPPTPSDQLPATIVRAVNPTPTVYAFPYYEDNPWQQMIYSRLEQAGSRVEPLTEVASLTDHARLLPGDILHLNWTAPISQNAATKKEALERVRESLTEVECARKHNVRLLWTVHNILPHECKYPDAEIELSHRLGALADAIMVMNPATAELASEFYPIPEEKVWMVPHSSYLGTIAEPVPRDRARSELGIDGDVKMVLCFGELRPYKQIDRVVDAFRRLDGDDLRLVIAGRPSGGLTEESILSMSGDDNRIVLRLGRQNDTEIASLFSAADLLVQDYRSGLNSGAAALSASFGCPVALGLGRETEFLRSEDWVIGLDLVDVDRASANLLSAIDRAVSDAASLRDAALSWSERLNPARVAQQFAEGVLTLSARGEIRFDAESEGLPLLHGS